MANNIYFIKKERDTITVADVLAQIKANNIKTSIKFQNQSIEQVLLTQKKTILEIQDKKVDKVEGKELSSNDYTTSEKNKLANLSNYDDTELKNLVNTKIDTNIVLTMANMGQDIKEAMTGGSVAVVGKNSILNENLVNKSISYNKTDCIITGTNVFDVSKIQYDKYLDTTGNVSNNSNGWMVSDYIPVLEGESYTARASEYSYYYDENKNMISKIETTTFTIPTNCKYIRFSIRNTPESFYVNKGNVNNYVPFGYKFTSPLPIEEISENVIENKNIKDKAIRENNCTFFSTPLNMINKDYLLENTTIYTYDGTILESKGYYATDFIKVLPSTSYCLLPAVVRSILYYQYDKDKNFISYNNENNGLFTTTDTTEYIRIVIAPDLSKDDLYLSKSDTIQTYTSGIPQILNKYLNIKELKDILEIPKKINTKNLFNEKTVIYDKHLDTAGNVTDNTAGWKVSDFIEVEENSSYRLSQNYNNLEIAHSYFYDGNKNMVSKLTDNQNPFTVPTGVKYVRFSIRNKVDYIQLEKGTEISYYIPYGYEEDYKELLSSPFLNKKYCPIGDSITATGWGYDLARELGMVITSYNAIGGTTVSGDYDGINNMCSTTRINAVPTNTEIITIMGGSNDWSQQIELGDLDDCKIGNIQELSKITFCGCYKLMLNRLYDRCPNAIIFILEQPYRYLEYTDRNIPLDNYRQKTKEIAYEYCYPVIKTYQNCGINQLNYSIYLEDVVHPNKLGQNRIVQVTKNEMLNSISS